jgi:hypothetical protein
LSFLRVSSTLNKLSADKVDTDSNGYVRVAYYNHSSLKKLVATDDNDSEYTYASSRVRKLAACSTWWRTPLAGAAAPLTRHSVASAASARAATMPACAQ